MPISHPTYAISLLTSPHCPYPGIFFVVLYVLRVCSREIKLFHAKMSLLLKIVEGSNTALYLPAEGAMRFLLPQLPGSEYNNHTSTGGQLPQEVRFLEVDIAMSPERMNSEEFSFTDKIWDELEAAQGVIDDSLSPPLPQPLVVVVDSNGVGGGSVDLSSGTGEGEEEEEGGSLVYTPVTTEECPSSADHQSKVGESFFDSEDRVNYKIVAVCTTTIYGPDKYFFKYINVDQFPSGPPGGDEGEGEVFEYTPCAELLSASWATWKGEEEQWIQCGECNKWRKVPSAASSSEGTVQLSDLPDEWTCSMAPWLAEGVGEGGAHCEVPEEAYEHTVSVTEAVNGILVAVPQPTLLSTTETTTTTAAASAATADDIVYTVDLQTAVRHIVSALKANVGNKLLTRLSPETTHGVLGMAIQN